MYVRDSCLYASTILSVKNYVLKFELELFLAGAKMTFNDRIARIFKEKNSISVLSALLM